MINFKKGGYCFTVHYRCVVELVIEYITIMDFVEFEFNDNSLYINIL